MILNTFVSTCIYRKTVFDTEEAFEDTSQLRPAPKDVLLEHSLEERRNKGEKFLVLDSKTPFGQQNQRTIFSSFGLLGLTAAWCQLMSFYKQVNKTLILRH